MYYFRKDTIPNPKCLGDWHVIWLRDIFLVKTEHQKIVDRTLLNEFIQVSLAMYVSII